MTLHPAIAAGVAANEEEARALDEFAEQLRYNGLVRDVGEALDMVRAATADSRMAEFEALVRAQMERDREANRTNRERKRHRCKARRRGRKAARR